MAEITFARTVANYSDSVSSKFDELREELVPKETLFIAPSRKYAETVMANLLRDLDKRGIDADYKVESHTLRVFTKAVTVRINWWDPVSWSVDIFRAYHALFGKKELVTLVKDKFHEYYFNTPKQSLKAWVIEQNDICKETPEKPLTKYIPEIKTVHFSYPATIVIWEDGTKTVVKCQKDDFYSPEAGLAICIAKKALGNQSNFNNIFKKWVPNDHMEFVDKTYSSMKDLIADLFGTPRNIYTVED